MLISCVWAADNISLNDKAIHLLKVIGKTFPKVTVWEAGHTYDRGYEDQFFRDTPFNDNMNLVEGLDALDLWQETIHHFAALELNSDFISVQYSCWSDELNDAVGVYFSESLFDVDTEEDEREEALVKFSKELRKIMIGLGSEVIEYVWLENNSVFAGEAICIYEPEEPFWAYYSSLTRDASIKPVQEIRRIMRSAFTAKEIAVMLEELGANVKELGNERLYVEFDKKLGGDGGKTIIPELERQISARLGKSDFRIVGKQY